VAPLASGFNICALAVPWRSLNSISSDGTQQRSYIPDPRWLIALNALSLFAAVLGNAVLLGNFAKRLSFAKGFGGAIGGLGVGSGLLVACVAVIGSEEGEEGGSGDGGETQGSMLTGAYYYALATALIYALLASCLSLSLYGAHAGYYSKDVVRLSSAARTLMGQTMAFMAWLLLGALVFSHIEGWAYLDAVYWADVTVLTIGLGDFAPRTTLGRVLMMPFAVGGVVCVGLVSIACSELLEESSLIIWICNCNRS
jgi:potassium channel subfamily K